MNMLNLFLKGNISVWCESRAEMEQLRDMVPDSFVAMASSHSLESFEETADLKEAGFVVDNNIFGNSIRILYYSHPGEVESVREFEEVGEYKFTDFVMGDGDFNEADFYAMIGVKLRGGV